MPRADVQIVIVNLKRFVDIMCRLPLLTFLINFITASRKAVKIKLTFRMIYDRLSQFILLGVSLLCFHRILTTQFIFTPEF